MLTVNEADDAPEQVMLRVYADSNRSLLVAYQTGSETGPWWPGEYHDEEVAGSAGGVRWVRRLVKSQRSVHKWPW